MKKTAKLISRKNNDGAKRKYSVGEIVEKMKENRDIESMNLPRKFAHAMKKISIKQDIAVNE